MFRLRAGSRAPDRGPNYQGKLPTTGPGQSGSVVHSRVSRSQIERQINQIQAYQPINQSTQLTDLIITMGLEQPINLTSHGHGYSNTTVVRAERSEK
ncbi:Uncharacterized protein HZ326_27029, partial [Fusarium oxysporum f. sp. albedinis]